MKKVRKTSFLAIFTLCFALVITACGGTKTVVNPSSPSAPAASAIPAKPTKVSFYGKIVEYPSGEPMVKEMQNELPELDIDATQVDWANLEKVLKTQIAAGSPPDVVTFWPQNMKTFVDANQALDLTPYLTANGGEWKNTFNQALLDLGKYNGKYYAVPMEANYSLFIVNADIFEKAGVQVPSQWSWDEFLTACKQLKEKGGGVFPFALSKDLQSFFLRNGILSLTTSDGKQDDFASGKIDVTTSPYVSTSLKNTKALYDMKYWYPGEGAMTISRDEAKAAFVQGKVAMLGEVSALYSGIVKDLKFKTVPVQWPSMGTKASVLGGAGGFFVPANAAHKDEAAKMLKTFLSAKIQKIHADAGFITANVNVKVENPIIQKLIELGNTVNGNEFMNISAKLTDYISNKSIPGYNLGNPLDQILGDIEKLRQEALKPQ